MKKTISIFLAVFLTAVLLTGCLSSGGNTVSVKCVTGLDVTQSNYGLTQQLRMDFDKKTGVLTAEAEGLRVEYAFNGNGELLSMYRYYTYAESWSSYVLTYDEAGKLICEENSASGSEGSKKEYFYDGAGKLEKSVRYNGDWLWQEDFYWEDGTLRQRIEHIYGYEEDFRHIFEYAEDGRVLTQRDVRDGKDTGGKEYVYDDHGVLLQVINYANEETRQESVYNILYDEKGNRIEESFTDSEGIAKWYRYTYDEDGNMLTQRYSEDPEGHGNNWTYDEEGRVISQSYGSGPAVYWTYDANGRIATYTSGDNVTSYTYTYKTFRLPEALAAAVAEAMDQLALEFVTRPIVDDWVF